MPKTIAAIATAQAPAGIGVIRISGEDALTIADTVFFSEKKSIITMQGYTAAYGKIIHDNVVLDEAIATVFRAPHSYTGENVVELSCHGGLFVLQKVLRAVLSAGASLAEPGEFTRRAFLNGKLELTQAEAVMNLISAQGEQAARAALSLRDGALSKRIHALSQSLISLSAHMAAWVDYPEEDIPALMQGTLFHSIEEIYNTLCQMLEDFNVGRIIREGINTVIVGKPNVGKSTLMNLLSGTRRSIVTDIAGTTRDVVEETVKVGDILLRLSDTAGLRETEDLVESVGVALALERLSSADLILAVFDGSSELDQDDLELLEKIRGRISLAVINKTDLPLLITVERVRDYVTHVVFVSAKDSQSYRVLEEEFRSLFQLDKLNPSEGILSTERQRDCCVRAKELLGEALSALQEGITLDAVNVCVDGAIDTLLELTGERASTRVVDEVFEKFCVGK